MTGIGEAVSASFANSLAQLIDKAFQNTVSRSKEGANALAVRLSVGFEKYIASTRSRCTNVKTLISSNVPISLAKAYEPAELKFGDLVVTIDKFIEELGEKRNRALVTASLGAGKSFTMKYIYSQFSNPGILSHIPLFIELRDINFSEESIITYIHKTLTPFTNFVSEKSVTSGLKAGAFCLLLDGFDEIQGKHQRIAEKQINRIAADYPKSVIVVSSRPDRERFVSWHSFPEFHVSPLSLRKLESLIDRIDFDTTKKGLFLKRVRGGLFKTHKKILSNPLLASMMLLTFGEFQDIPGKMHVFYGTAFDVLYRRHDTIKPDYQREFKCGLDLNDFKRFFMTFCFMSFIDRRFSFSEKTFASYAKRAIEYEELDASTENMLYDLTKNVCIMQVEGDDINFIHRSFQEYFSALFLSKRSVEKSYEYVDFLFREATSDDFFMMFIEMDKDEFERKYLIKKVEALSNLLNMAKSLKEKSCEFAKWFVVGKIGDNNYVVMPVGYRIRIGVKDATDSNIIAIIAIIGKSYGIDEYSVEGWARDGWQKKVPKVLAGEESARLIEVAKLPATFLTAIGLKGYLAYLSKRIREVDKELGERHTRKAKLLSESLRKS